MELPTLAWCLASVLVGAELVQAYPTPVDYDGELLRWDVTPENPVVLYEISYDDSDDYWYYFRTIGKAAELWSGIKSSSLRLQEAEKGETSQITIHLKREIEGSTTSSGYSIYDEHNDDNSKPVHCSSYILTDPDLSSLGVAKTILHELGHCLGLGHSLIPEAIMSYSITKNDFALDTDDKAAISRLYPADRSEGKVPPGCAIGSGEGQNRSTTPILVLILLPLLTLLWTQQRQHHFWRLVRLRLHRQTRLG